MSGPKLIEMRRRARAARIQKNRDLCDQCDAEYGRLCAEYRRLNERLAELGGDPGKPLDDAGEIAAVFRGLLERGQDEEAGRRYPHQVAFARSAVDEARLALGGRIATLHERLRRARSDAEALGARREELAAGADETRKEQIAGCVIPDTRGVREEDVASLERLESELKSARERLESLGARVSEAKDLQDPQIAGQPGRSLADWVKQRRSSGVGAIPTDTGLRSRVASVFAEAAAFDDPPLWAELRRLEGEFDGVSHSADADAERSLYVMNMEAALLGARERAAFRREALAMLDRAAVFPGPEVERETQILRACLESGRVEPLEPVRARLDAALRRAEATREHEERRRAVIESLEELGYTANDGLQTAFAKGGRLLLQKDEQTDYAVEVVADAALDRIQTSMVRFAADSEMTEDRRLRDREEEGHWCQDHARLRRKLEERGWESGFVMQRPAGEHPVRVIVDQKRAARQKATQSVEVRPRARKAPLPGHDAS